MDEKNNTEIVGAFSVSLLDSAKGDALAEEKDCNVAIL